MVSFVLALNRAHCLALNGAHVLRPNKADVLPLNGAHVLRLDTKISPMFTTNTKRRPSAASAKGCASLFIGCEHWTNLSVETQDMCLVENPDICPVETHCMCLRAMSCALLRANTKAAGFGRSHKGGRPSGAPPVVSFVLALNRAHVLGLNTAQVLRLNKANVLA